MLSEKEQQENIAHALNLGVEFGKATEAMQRLDTFLKEYYPPRDRGEGACDYAIRLLRGYKSPATINPGQEIKPATKPIDYQQQRSPGDESSWGWKQ